MLVALKSALYGSRLKIYENVYKSQKAALVTEDGAGETYRLIKKRLFRFLETATEKQIRVQNEWEALYRHKGMNAMQFEAEWERINCELDEVGLGKNPLEKLLAYIMKVGTPVSETIRMDRRPRKDGAGGLTTRLPDTWEECHEVLRELESMKAGSKAFQSARAAPQQPSHQGHGQAGHQGGQGGKKGDGGKGKGKGGGKNDGTPAKGVCYEFRDTGKCSRGNSCHFSHSAADTGRHPSGALTKAGKKALKEREANAAGGKPTKPSKKGKGAGKGDGGKGKGKGDGAKTEKKELIQKLCKYVKDPSLGPCPQGVAKCRFYHSKKFFDANGNFTGKPKAKAKGKTRAKGGPQDLEQGEGGEDDSWENPVGLHGGGPQVLIREYRPETGEKSPKPGSKKAQQSCEPSSTPAADATPTLRSHGIQGVVKTVESPQGQQKSGKVLNSLAELPERVWVEAESDESGIQFFTDVVIGVSTHPCMLDGGSGVNSTTEELVLKILNEQERAGIPLNDKRHPIKALEKWKHKEAIRGVAGSKKVRLVGAVVVQVKMVELGKDEGPVIDVRFKICEKGSTDWVGWILGARAIDCSENGGLGLFPWLTPTASPLRASS